MAKKKKQTFAAKAKQIESRYYKARKPGDDPMTDEAYNREMSALMQQQESVKAADINGPTHTMPDGTVMPGATHEESTQQYAGGGGLSRGKDYGSKKKPYPSVAKKDFAGGGRSYPIPTRADAVDALRLAGLHGRSDIRAKVYAKYPDLKKKGNGGSLSEYQYGGEFDPNYAPGIFGQGVKTLSPSSYGGQNQLYDRGLDLNVQNQQQRGFGGRDFSPMANVLGPALNIGSEFIASQELRKGAEGQRTRLEGLAGVNLGRVDPAQIDLGRERADIRSQQALTEAGGRYYSRGARSASEAANIRNQARIGGQRVAGNLLSRSYQTEEQKNAELRARAAEQNRQLSAQEKMIRNQQLMDIERQYGGIPSQLRANLARTTGRSLSNYLAENQRMARDRAYLNMINPNIGLDYQSEFEELNPFNRGLARLGVRNVNPNITVR